MKRAFLTICCMVLAVAGTMAANRLYIEDFSIEAGETKRVNLMMDNDIVFTAFQVDFVLPDGLTIGTKSNGKPNVTINTDRADDHQMVTNIREDGTVSILMMSLESTPIMGNSGAIVSFNLIASDDFSGTHRIEVINGEMTQPNGQAVKPADTYCTVTGPGGSVTPEPGGNRLYIEDFSIDAGETKRVNLMMDNDIVFTAFQVDFVLPDGLTIGTKSNGKPNVTINTDRADDHQMVTNIREDGTVSILMMSLESTPIMGNSGAIVSFNLIASDDFSGTHRIEVINGEMTQPNGQAVKPADTYCTVTGPSAPQTVLATAITLSQTTAEVTVGENLQLTATILPENATDRTVTWTSSDPAVATVDATGLVTAVAAGTATVTATTNDGSNLTAACAVTVKPAVVPATSVTLNETTAEVTVGETLQLTATVLPEDATDQSVTWSSIDEGVATVDETGKVTAVAPGTATITATTNDGSNLSAACTVTVKPAVVPATSVTLNETTAEVTVGETLQLTATVAPENASNPTVTWSSSDDAIATVDANGLVTAVAAGTAIITASTTDGSNLSASCEVTVKQLAVSLTLDKTAAEVTVGETLLLNATVLPDNTSNPAVTWSSSNDAVATVDANGLVTAVASGTATITATTADGSNLTASCSVTVKQLAVSLTLDKTAAEVTVGETLQLTATVVPDNTSNPAVTWSSSNDAVATVDETGKITAIAAGTATITATTTDGSNLTASCEVTVKPAVILVNSIVLDKTTAEVVEGGMVKLTATVLPEDATDKSVTWTTSDAAIATVNEDGLVTAVAPGTVTITVSAKDGSDKTATCEVTVLDSSAPHLGLKLSEKAFRLQLNQTHQVTVVTEGVEGVIWSSSDTSIASVDASGVVTAHKNGIAIITATAANGATMWCAVYSYSRGDVDESNSVDVTDVNQVISIILGKE